MLCKASLVLPIGAYGDIIRVLKLCHGFWPEFKALLKAAKRQSLVFFVKAVGSAKKAAGSEGPSVLVIAAIDKGLL